tara:strand:+ start:732 stop:1223 length:492 start_codon:yes stop_codon:yes gene_type:complete
MANYDDEIYFSAPGVNDLYREDLGNNSGLDVLLYFDRNYETIKSNLKDINLGTLVDALKILNEQGVSSLFQFHIQGSFDGRKTVDNYLDLIKIKGEMIKKKEQMIKKIIKDNKQRHTVRRVIKEKELPDDVKENITNYLVAGSKKHKKTRKSGRVRKTRGKKH